MSKADTANEQELDELEYSGNVVMLKPNWGGNFQRSVRDADGQIIETLVFTPGDPMPLTDEQYEAVSRDIGNCLVEVDEKLFRKMASKVVVPGGDESGEPDAELAAEVASLEVTVEELQGKVKTLTEEKAELESKLAMREAELEALADCMAGPVDEAAAGDPAKKQKAAPKKKAAKKNS